jgi:hypothetical protein
MRGSCLPKPELFHRLGGIGKVLYPIPHGILLLVAWARCLVHGTTIRGYVVGKDIEFGRAPLHGQGQIDDEVKVHDDFLLGLDFVASDFDIPDDMAAVAVQTVCGEVEVIDDEAIARVGFFAKCRDELEPEVCA